jgi:creatinine amidohydrolase
MPHVARLSWDEVAGYLEAGRDALLPIGAAAKEHGLHLPMDTDARQAEWLAAKLEEETGLLVWPTVTYGFYPAFRDFPGSVSLSRETFAVLLHEIVADILRHGARFVFVLDTGISTMAPVAEVIAGFGARAVHLKVHDGPRYREAAAQASQPYGSHADELETSRMLAMAPAVVRMEKAAATPSPTPFSGPLTGENAPSGSYGDPTRATAAFGAALWDAMLADLRETIAHARSCAPATLR